MKHWPPPERSTLVLIVAVAAGVVWILSGGVTHDPGGLVGFSTGALLVWAQILNNRQRANRDDPPPPARRRQRPYDVETDDDTDADADAEIEEWQNFGD